MHDRKKDVSAANSVGNQVVDLFVGRGGGKENKTGIDKVTGDVVEKSLERSRH